MTESSQSHVPAAAVATPVARLLAALAGETVEPRPVICPGGMMTMATTSAMRRSAHSWPAAHADAGAMAEIVLATQEESGLDCLSVPFCMTVEAEALGCEIDLGTACVIPHVAGERFADADGVRRSLAEAAAAARTGTVAAGSACTCSAGLGQLLGGRPYPSARMRTVCDALRRLKRARPALPAIGAVVGPVSLAAMVLEAGVFLRLVRREPDTARRLVDAMAEVTLRFALDQAEAGADVLMLAEPSATGDVLGPVHFERLALAALTRVLRDLRRAGPPAILHICGDVRPLVVGLGRLAAETGGHLPLSVDAMVSGRALADLLPGCVRVGNVDAVVLQRGPAAAVEASARRAAAQFHVVSPACGLVPETPPTHLRLLTSVVHGSHAGGGAAGAGRPDRGVEP